MKKLFVVAVLLFVPLLATAQQPDALLTPDGTLFTVGFERAEDHPEVITDSAAYLKLTARRGGEVTSEIIPATLTGGRNSNATLAYDSPSGILFVFWIQTHGLLSNQLMFASRSADGVWSDARVFGDGFYDYRKNLRVAVTRKFRDDDDEDLHSGLSVHLAWWELNTTTGKYGAKYAMASIHDGSIVDFASLDLGEFVEPAEMPSEVASEHVVTGSEILTQPVFFTTPIQDSVILLFGDIETNTLNQVRITPRRIAGTGRLRVPGGRREGSFRAPMMTTGNSRLEGIFADSTRMALYSLTDGKLSYVLLDGRRLSDTFDITLDEHLPAPSAVDALRRLVIEKDEH